jgi:hypothetical protein
MTAIRRDPKGRLDHLHRAGAIVFGLGLAGFGVIGMLNQLELFSTTGRVLLGLSTNGALAILSVTVGAVLVVAGVIGGRVASTALVVAGVAFVLSGVVNVLVLNTALNLLAFRMSNVVFSMVAGLLLLILGSWGRFAGHLPHDNPYWQERHAHDAPPAELPTHFYDPADARAAAELAEADRAVAQHTASPELVARVEALRGLRREEDRIRAWRGQHA